VPVDFWVVEIIAEAAGDDVFDAGLDGGIDDDGLFYQGWRTEEANHCILALEGPLVRRWVVQRCDDNGNAVASDVLAVRAVLGFRLTESN